MSPRPIVTFLALGLLGTAALQAEQDLPPINVNQLLNALHTMSDQQAQASKTQKLTAYQQISAAANSPERAVGLWEEAVRATQMEGAGKEGTQFKLWKDGEGELFKEREVQNAVHLHLEWLALTLQHSAGTTVKEMLPSVMAYIHELVADQAWMDALEDTVKKDAPGVNKVRAAKAKDDVAIRKTHDSVLNHGLGNSVVVQWLKLGDAVNVDQWENNPNNLDGIYKNIVQPELRAEKDQRVFEYWDYKLKKEADAASKTRLSFEMDKFNTLRMPVLLWNRIQEYAVVGQKNRAMTEMFNLIKKYPTHPSAPDWISTLEALAAPTDAPATTALPAPAPAAAPTAAAPEPANKLPGSE
jgi:hypothetical protein